MALHNTMTYYQAEINRIKDLCYSNNKQVETVIATKNFIDRNFDRALNLDLLSHIRFTSKFHLLRLFKKYYGITPKQYLTIKRIEASKQYLQKGMTISEACYCAGFETPSSFSTLFKSKMGCSPIAYQKEQFSQSGLNSDSGTCRHESKTHRDES